MEKGRLTGKAAITLRQSKIRIDAKNFEGEVRWHGARGAGTRSATGEDADLVGACEEAELEDKHTLVLDGAAKDGAEVELEVPVGVDEVQYALLQAEDNTIRIVYPEHVRSGPAGVRSTRRQERYRISLPRPKGRAGVRGLLAKVGTFVIKFVVRKVVRDATGKLVMKGVDWWESRNRAFEGFHGGGFDALLAGAPQAYADWDRVQGPDRRALLLVHGTTSSTAGGFGPLADFPDVQAELHAAYGDRVLGFNHHTLGKTVAENVKQFFETLPKGEYEFDVVTHSRGGLVARALLSLPDSALDGWRRPADRAVKIRRVVFVGTPNAGTVLAVPERLPGFLEWAANLVAKFPDSIGTVALSALLSLAAAVAETGMAIVPGLRDQQPGSGFLNALKDDPGAAARYFGIRAEYDYAGDAGLLNLVKDLFMDHAFADEPNDLIVPTRGVTKSPAFDLPTDRYHEFAPGEGVYHTNFFTDARTWAKVLDYLKR